MSEAYHIIQRPLFPSAKICPRCSPPTEKPIDQFYRNRSTPDGYSAYCKECTRAYINAASRANPEKAREKERKRVRDRTKTRAYNRKSYAKHREQRTTHGREKYASDPERRKRKRDWGVNYREGNSEQRHTTSKRYYETHKTYFKEKDMRRKARKKQVTVEKVSYDRILERDGLICYICGKGIDPTAKSRTTAALVFDHVIPLQPRPGEPQGIHAESNIKPTHHCCNVRKSNKPFEVLTDWEKRGP